MYRKIFLAGATGAIGSRLMPLLLDAGYEVFGTTRSKTKAAALQALGITPVVVDVFDAPALSRAIAAIRPEVVINQLTDLPAALEASGMAEGIARTTRIRIEGTRNLVTAALEPGIFNIAEDTGYVSIAKARRELGWDPGFRLGNREATGALSTTHRSQSG
jgi:nucleoside-diphosphate-sugar epimerase